jgi:hypothetical protein
MGLRISEEYDDTHIFINGYPQDRAGCWSEGVGAIAVYPTQGGEVSPFL